MFGLPCRQFLEDQAADRELEREDWERRLATINHKPARFAYLNILTLLKKFK